MAEIYMNCGEFDKALEELDLALSQESFVTVHSLKYARWLNPVRDRSEYKRLVQRYTF